MGSGAQQAANCNGVGALTCAQGCAWEATCPDSQCVCVTRTKPEWPLAPSGQRTDTPTPPVQSPPQMPTQIGPEHGIQAQHDRRTPHVHTYTHAPNRSLTLTHTIATPHAGRPPPHPTCSNYKHTLPRAHTQADAPPTQPRWPKLAGRPPQARPTHGRLRMCRRGRVEAT